MMMAFASTQMDHFIAFAKRVIPAMASIAQVMIFVIETIFLWFPSSYERVCFHFPFYALPEENLDSWSYSAVRQ